MHWPHHLGTVATPDRCAMVFGRRAPRLRGPSMREAALSLPEGHFAVGGRVYKRAEGGEDGVSPRLSTLSTMSEEARRLMSSDNLPAPTGDNHQPLQA